jgi:hypothetical protein
MKAGEILDLDAPDRPYSPSQCRLQEAMILETASSKEMTFDAPA